MVTCIRTRQLQETLNKSTSSLATQPTTPSITPSSDSLLALSDPPNPPSISTSALTAIMSLVSGVLTLPAPPSNHHPYFRKLSRWQQIPNRRTSPKLLTMEPPLSPPIVDNDAVLQSLVLPDFGLSMLPESAKSLDSQPPSTMLETWASTSRGNQDAVAVVAPVSERPMVPTSPSDWEARKPIIRELYMEQNMILNEVIEIMVTKYKFKATYVLALSGDRDDFSSINSGNSARMYKGQFAKWKWTKYNKSGKPASIKPTKSRASKKISLLARRSPGRTAGMKWVPSTETRHSTPLSHRVWLQYFTDEQWQVETTLGAYGTLISHWCERETPWKTEPSSHDLSVELYEPQRHSILQYVRAAQDYFLSGHPHQGGDMLRRAFLGIETAISRTLDVEALWDCCLAVPQLVLTTGWTDLLSIFSRYLHQYTSIKLPATHPLTKIAAALHRLSRQTSTTTKHHHQQLALFVSRAWHLWIDCVTRARGRHDDVTIHLKRGYITLVDPLHVMARDIIADFGLAVQDSLAKRGAFATTSRILELENLLVRMYLPLFIPETARRAEEMLGLLRGRIAGKEGNVGRAVHEWEYMDRYLVFSADWFMASIAEYNGEWEKAAGYRRRSLDSARDLFWVQTSLLVESRLRAAGDEREADRIREERAEAQGELQIGLGQMLGV